MSPHTGRRRTTPPGLTLHFLDEPHLSQVAEIEQRCFACPLAETELAAMLAHASSVLVVALLHGRVVGYFAANPAADRGVIEIVSFAVDPGSQRQGIGRRMFGEVRKLTSAATAELIVRETNTAGVRFFYAVGFRAVGVVGQPWEGCPDDAYAMRCDLRRPTNRISSFLP